MWGFSSEFSGLVFTVGGTSVTLTSLAIAVLAGIALNAILPGKNCTFSSDVTRGRSGDRGRYWDGKIKAAYTPDEKIIK